MEKRDGAEDLDGAAGDPDLFAVAARHLPGALRRADLGACLRHRSDARRLHPGDPDRSSSAARWRCSPGAPRELQPGGLFAPISREGALVLNNLLLTTAAPTVLLGTLYPLALEALTGDKISVGAPFFNLTFGAADGAAACRDAVRAAAGLEARRPPRRRAAPGRGLRRRRARHAGGAGRHRRRPVLCARSASGSALSDARRARPISAMRSRLCRGRRRRGAAGARAACRARRSAPRSPISASGVTLLGIVAHRAWRRREDHWR